MKRLVNAASDNQIAQAKKFVRQLIYTVWTCDENGRPVEYFSDPSMLCNILIDEYKRSGTYESFSKWIYNQRDDIFRNFVYNELDRSKYSEEVIDIAKDYFDNLTQSDYNRNLYLSRENKEINK